MVQSFLVTGCARSGTQYISKFFCALGIPCTHEYIFNPTTLASEDISWPPAFEGESSWMAAPFIGKLPSGITVYHQVRHPLAVVRSLIRIGLFSTRRPFAAYSNIISQVEPRITQGSEIEQCFRYWLYWNQLTERRALDGARDLIRFRIEDLEAPFLHRMVREVHPELGLSDVETILQRVDRATHTFGDKNRDDRLTWESIDGPLRRDVLDLAARYGYEEGTSSLGQAA